MHVIDQRSYAESRAAGQAGVVARTDGHVCAGHQRGNK